MRRPNTLQEVTRTEAGGEVIDSAAMAGFLDSFYVDPDRRQAMIDPAPALTGTLTVDALLGAIGEHLARRWNLRIPAWTKDTKRFLERPLFSSKNEALKAMLLAQSPLAFRRRLIFVEGEPLRRARMPRSRHAPT